MQDNQNVRRPEGPTEPEKGKNNNPFNRKPVKGSGGGRPSGPRFSLYWVYGIIAVLLMTMLLLPGYNSPKETNTKELIEMLRSHDVKKIVVVNEKVAEIYLTEEALKNEKYKEKLKSPGLFGEDRPHFQMEIGNYEVFRKDVDNAQASFAEKERIYPDPVERHNLLLDLLGYIAPFLILLVIFLFFMRRIGGGTGGPGSQIFNIGKSKAQLFDKDTQVNVT
ncbi:MAG TPA: ATP-dependent metallopeptidase FtsH/Yme1/Tma family protein, partial [Bacteroidia bacterium]|nr:ATP-dependent metallopeptidase FtsH/Yme1/Tma family protein [Bacteroidia bacterium]